MGLFKADFFRFFALGFAVGAALMFATVDRGPGSGLTGGVVPAASAATAQGR